jgi:putative addiction module component (TIGR02574 family)
MTEKSMDQLAEAEWEKEITRRIADLNAGSVKPIPWTELRRRLLAKLTHDQ